MENDVDRQSSGRLLILDVDDDDDEMSSKQGNFWSRVLLVILFSPCTGFLCRFYTKSVPVTAKKT